MAEKAESAASKGGHTVKETVTSLVIAFVFAFVFRGFVIEAFVIPTGSMAPTLLGQHVRIQSPESGFISTVDPWDRATPTSPPSAVQGSQRTMGVSDPMTGGRVGVELPGELGQKRRLLSGDRIFVLKYLYSIFDPSRFDVVVFKYPGRGANDAVAGEQENYIKRLLGVPGEEIALVDGDVFYRRAPAASAGSLERSDWTSADWRIARKSERVQRALWQAIYDSRYAPLEPERNLRRWFDDPWLGESADGSTDPAWTIADSRSYTYEGSGATTMRWDHEAWPIDDRYYYNESPNFPTRGPLSNTEIPRKVFPVSDVRLALGLEPEGEGVEATAVVEARGHEFRAAFDASGVRLSMRSTEGGGGEPVVLATEERSGLLEAGRVNNIELWHVDQSLQVWVEGRKVVEAEYDWSPALRAEHATGQDQSDLLFSRNAGNPLAVTTSYRAPRVRWEFDGGPFTLHRVRLARDLHYQPGVYTTRERNHTREGEPTLGTHPAQPCVLGPDHFLLCGDNSPNSLDARAWDTPDPWVYADIDPTIGVVHRDLVIGKAFFVYFPSIHKERRVPVPDVGRMRFIW